MDNKIMWKLSKFSSKSFQCHQASTNGGGDKHEDIFDCIYLFGFVCVCICICYLLCLCWVLSVMWQEKTNYFVSEFCSVSREWCSNRQTWTIPKFFNKSCSQITYLQMKSERERARSMVLVNLLASISPKISFTRKMR